MITKEQIRFKKFIKAVSCGIGERCGCNDDDSARTKRWLKLFNTKDDKIFKEFLENVFDSVAYE